MITGASDTGGPDGKLFYYDGSRMNHGVRMSGSMATAQLSLSVNART